MPEPEPPKVTAAPVPDAPQSIGSAGSGDQEQSTAIATVADMNSKLFHMSKQGYIKDAIVKHRKPNEFAHTSKCPLWAITSIGEKVATISPTGCWGDEPRDLTLEDLKDDWTITNQKPQTLVQFHCAVPERQSSWNIDFVLQNVKTLINCQSELRFADGVYEAIEIFQNPWCVRVKEGYEFEEGEFALAPATTVIKARKTSDPVPTGHIDIGELLAVPPTSFSLGAPAMTASGDKPFIAPFWAVPAAPDNHRSAPMVHKVVDMEISVSCDGQHIEKVVISIPLLINCTKLLPGDFLNYLKKDREAVHKQIMKRPSSSSGACKAKRARAQSA